MRFAPEGTCHYCGNPWGAHEKSTSILLPCEEAYNAALKARDMEHNRCKFIAYEESCNASDRGDRAGYAVANLIRQRIADESDNPVPEQD